MKKLDTFILAIIVLGLITLIPFLFESTITQGQLGKQIFQAEQAKSYLNNETQGFFPLRHFLEIHHESVTPWASEFPIYSILVAKISQLTGINFIIIGRVTTFFFFLIILFAAYKIGLLFEKDKKIYLFFPLSITLFPVFKIYSISFMPDIPMTALIMLGIYFSLKRKTLLASLFFIFASLFKYYAAFANLGVMLFIFFKRKNKWFDLILLGLSPLPAIIYLYYVFKMGIPNPITEYKTYFNEGHISSLSSIFSIKIYLRALTWIFIKNPTILGSLMVAIGIFSSLKLKILNEKESQIIKLTGFLSISSILFIIVFGSSFYVHDYYGLQISIITSLFASIGFYHLMTQQKKIIYIIFPVIIFFSYSFVATKSSLIKQPYYLNASEIVKKATKPNDKILVITDLVTPSIPFYSNRIGWMLNIDFWDMYINYTQKRLASEKLSSVIVFLRKTSHMGFKSIYEFLDKNGWSKVYANKSFPSTHRKVPETEIWVINRR